MALKTDRISNHFDVPSKKAMDEMSLIELRVIGKNLNQQRAIIADLYRQAASYLQKRIDEQSKAEQQARREANPEAYDALHQGIGTDL